MSLFAPDTEEQLQQDQQRTSSAGRGRTASKTRRARMHERSTVGSVWRMRRPFRRHRHATTAFSVVPEHDGGRDSSHSTAERDSSLESDRRPTGNDAETDIGGWYPELPDACHCGSRPGRGSETEWNRVAEVLDRFFFFVFIVLLLIPTVTVLGIIRLFKPEL